jgi:hypothetical protein
MAGSEGGDGGMLSPEDDDSRVANTRERGCFQHGMLSPEDDDSADELSHLVDPYVTNCDASRVDTTRPSTFV